MARSPVPPSRSKQIDHLDDQGRAIVESAARNFALIGVRIDELEDLPKGQSEWTSTPHRLLRHAAASCASEVARILNTTLDRALWILSDFRCALEDAEREHDPGNFVEWLVEEADFTGYLQWIDALDDEGDDADDAAE